MLEDKKTQSFVKNINILDNEQVINVQTVDNRIYVYSLTISFVSDSVHSEWVYFYKISVYNLKGCLLHSKTARSHLPSNLEESQTTGGISNLGAMWVTEDHEIFLYGLIKKNDDFTEPVNFPTDFDNNPTEGQYIDRIFLARLTGETFEQKWFITNTQSFNTIFGEGIFPLLTSWLNVIKMGENYEVYLATSFLNLFFLGLPPSTDFNGDPIIFPEILTDIVVYKLVDYSDGLDPKQKWIKTAGTTSFEFLKDKIKMQKFVKVINQKAYVYITASIDFFGFSDLPGLDFNGQPIPIPVRGNKDMFVSLLEDMGSSAEQKWFLVAGSAANPGTDPNSGPLDFINTLDIDCDGNLYVAGTLNAFNTGLHPPIPGNNPFTIFDFERNDITNQFKGSAFIAKINLQGKQVYFKTFGDLLDFDSPSLLVINKNTKLSTVTDLRINNRELYLCGAVGNNPRTQKPVTDISGKPLNLENNPSAIFVAKTDLNGDQLEFKTMGGLGIDIAYGLDFYSGKIALTGQLDRRARCLKDFNGKRIKKCKSIDYLLVTLCQKNLKQTEKIFVFGNELADETSGVTFNTNLPYLTLNINGFYILYLFSVLNGCSGKMNFDPNLYFNGSKEPAVLLRIRKDC